MAKREKRGKDSAVDYIGLADHGDVGGKAGMQVNKHLPTNAP